MESSRTPLAMTYRLTLPEFMKACHAHWKAHKQGARTNSILGLIGCLIGIALWPIDSRSLFLLVPGGLLLLMVLVRSFLWRRAFHQAKKYRGEISLRFSDESIHVETIDGVSDLKWSFYSGYLDTPDYVLLYATPQGFSVIPKSAFATPIDRQDFLNLVSSKLASVV